MMIDRMIENSSKNLKKLESLIFQFTTQQKEANKLKMLIQHFLAL